MINDDVRTPITKTFREILPSDRCKDQERCDGEKDDLAFSAFSTLAKADFSDFDFGMQAKPGFLELITFCYMAHGATRR